MGCQTVYTLNALTLLRAFDDPTYARVLGRADVVLADGVGAAWAARRLTGRTPERTPGIDLLAALCGICAQEGQSVFLLGGKPGVAARAGTALVAHAANLRIAGCREGYWPDADEAGVVDEINRSGAGLLLVGLGQPRQEWFLDRWRETLQARLAVGVGGSFDVLAGDLRRAPVWMQRVGLEWLFRTLQQPARLARIWQLPRFVWRVLRTRFRR